MKLSIISNLLSGIGEATSKVMGSVAGLKRIKTVDKTQQENNLHAETVEMLKAYTAEMGKPNKNLWDSIVDGIVRLPRPIIAYIVIALFLICIISPEYAKRVAMAFYGLPTQLYYILAGVIAFYFGGRMVHEKMQASRPNMTTEQHTSLMTMVQTTEKNITDSNAEVIKENKKIMEALQDEDSDNLDDRGVKQIEIDEGWYNRLYKCPAGFNTIGYGFNLDAITLPKHIGKAWLIYLINAVIKELKVQYPIVKDLDNVRFWIVVNMAYNLGVYNTKTFKNTMIAIEKEIFKRKPNYKKVVHAMKSGKWYKQVGNRSKRLVRMMETGKWV